MQVGEVSFVGCLLLLPVPFPWFPRRTDGRVVPFSLDDGPWLHTQRPINFIEQGQPFSSACGGPGQCARLRLVEKYADILATGDRRVQMQRSLSRLKREPNATLTELTCLTEPHLAVGWRTSRTSRQREERHAV